MVKVACLSVRNVVAVSEREVVLGIGSSRFPTPGSPQRSRSVQGKTAQVREILV